MLQHFFVFEEFTMSDDILNSKWVKGSKLDFLAHVITGISDWNITFGQSAMKCTVYVL